MRLYSVTLFKMKLPKGFIMYDEVNETGITQTSLSFKFECLFSDKAFRFADKFANTIQRIHEKDVE